jgi:hypothetical protein
MCAAILSTVGGKFDARVFLAASSLKKYAECGTGGFQIIVSDAEKLSDQIAACISFIDEHSSELTRLRAAPGIESIDFRIAYYWEESTAALAYTLPEEFHSALARVRATLTFCVYPCAKEEPNQLPEPTSGLAPGRGSS